MTRMSPGSIGAWATRPWSGLEKDHILKFLSTKLKIENISTYTSSSTSSSYSYSSSSSSSSSVGPVAKPQMYRSLVGLLYSPYTPTCLQVPTFAARYPHIPNARDPSSKRWNCVGENWSVILPEIVTSMSIQGSFTCRKSATWDPRLYFPSEGRRAEDFITLKNPDGYGQVWTRALGYLKTVRYP